MPLNVMLRKYQQYVWLSIFFLSFTENLFAQPADTSAIVKQLVQQVKAVYAPDKRVKVWVVNEPAQGSITGYTTEPAAIALLKKKLDSANLSPLSISNHFRKKALVLKQRGLSVCL
ncbi:MAG: hypothetical protein IPH18_05040 [Chitinophagaceae bacterium]|nr:hypothetical protein [Chitinophagaceae bacterium]